MVRAIRFRVGLDRARRDGVTEQISRAATNVAAHFLLAQRCQSMQGADVVDTGGNCRIAIAQGAVEVKENGVRGHFGGHELFAPESLSVVGRWWLRVRPTAAFCSRVRSQARLG